MTENPLPSAASPIPLPPVALPDEMPQTLPNPKFNLGTAVRWREVPLPDFGRVIGMIYTDEAAHRVTGLHYLVLLDPHSPSRSICAHDFAFEEDLEPVQPGEHSL